MTTLEENHEYLSNILYSKDNYNLAKNILKKRTKINDDEIVNGFSWIYELDREIILELDSRKYFVSVAVLEHELTHVIQAINNNNPKKQYNEVLSFFVEFLSLELLSQKYNNPDIYKNAIINRFINCMSRRVYASEFEDEYLDKKSDYIKKIYIGLYPYMLGFIYAIRLLDLYHLSPIEIIEKFNMVLSGKKTVDELLNDYHISLEDKATILSFKNSCDIYREFVMEKHDKSNIHFAR